MEKYHFNTIEEAIADLKHGKVIIICDDQNRENEGDFATLAENINPDIINFMITEGKGLVCAPISQEIANHLKLEPMTITNTDKFTTNFTVSIDFKTNTTGISAIERADTIKAIINNNISATDFKKPGHIFPLVGVKNGVLERAGHTEAIIDLAKICNKKHAGVICEIISQTGKMATQAELFAIAKKFSLKIISIKDIIHYRKKYDKLVHRESITTLPTKFGEFYIYGYSNIISTDHTVAIIKGNPQNFNTPFVRIHSECLTGDVFHSLRCDCGEQLEMALSTIEEEGQGIIIYLRQEGRGIGLLNKLKAYELQEQGLDTFDANLALGFDADMREYFIASQILKDLGITTIQLVTNNPHKINELEQYGITIENRIPVTTNTHEQNINYIQTKIKKFGHLIEEKQL